MESDIESQARIFPPEEPRREREVRGAADGKKLREPLNDAKRDRLKRCHDLLAGSDVRYSDSYLVTMASRENRSRASDAASILISDQRFLFCRISSAAAAIPGTSPTPQRTPVSPSRTTSGRPPAFVPITGTPLANASRALKPKDSL